VLIGNGQQERRKKASNLLFFLLGNYARLARPRDAKSVKISSNALFSPKN